MPGSLQILVSLFFIFGDLGCVIFFTTVSVCKARQSKLSKNVDKHFRNLISPNQRKTKDENGMKKPTRAYFVLKKILNPSKNQYLPVVHFGGCTAFELFLTKLQNTTRAWPLHSSLMLSYYCKRTLWPQCPNFVWTIYGII